MKVLKTGVLGVALSGSGCTGQTFGSGTSTPPIDLTRLGPNPVVGVWISMEGNFGVAGASLSVIWKGSYAKSGATYTAFQRGNTSGLTGSYIIKTAKTTSGFFSNGTVLKVIQPCMPWIRLEAIQTRAGTTNSGILRWAVCAF